MLPPFPSRVSAQLYTEAAVSFLVAQYGKIGSNYLAFEGLIHTRRQDIEIYYSFIGKIDLPEA